MQRPGLARGAAASSSTAVLTVALIVLTALALRPPFTAVAPLLPEIQRDLGFAVGFGDQQLLVDAAPAAVERVRKVGVRRHEVVDRVAEIETIKVPDQRLQLREHHRQ